MNRQWRYLLQYIDWSITHVVKYSCTDFGWPSKIFLGRNSTTPSETYFSRILQTSVSRSVSSVLVQHWSLLNIQIRRIELWRKYYSFMMQNNFDGNYKPTASPILAQHQQPLNSIYHNRIFLSTCKMSMLNFIFSASCNIEQFCSSIKAAYKFITGQKKLNQYHCYSKVPEANDFSVQRFFVTKSAIKIKCTTKLSVLANVLDFHEWLMIDSMHVITSVTKIRHTANTFIIQMII